MAVFRGFCRTVLHAIFAVFVMFATFSSDAFAVQWCDAGYIMPEPGLGVCSAIPDVDFSTTGVDAGMFNFLDRYPDYFGGDVYEKLDNYIDFYGLGNIDEIKQHIFSAPHYVLDDATCDVPCDSDMESATNDTNFGTSFWYLNSSPVNSRNYIIYNDGSILGVDQNNNGKTWQYNYATDGSFTGITYPNYAVESAVMVHDIESVNNVVGLAFCPLGSKISDQADHIYENCAPQNEDAAVDVTIYAPRIAYNTGQSIENVIIREIFGKGWAVVDKNDDEEIWLINYESSNGSRTGGGTAYYYGNYLTPPNWTFSDLIRAAYQALNAKNGYISDTDMDDAVDNLLQDLGNQLDYINIDNSTSLQENVYVFFDVADTLQDIIYDNIPHQSTGTQSDNFLLDNTVSSCPSGTHLENGICVTNNTTITFNTNGGSGTIKNNLGNTSSNSMTCLPGATSIALPTYNANTSSNNTTNIAKSGKVFLGWSTNQNEASGSFSITCPNANTTYYAIWGTPICNDTHATSTSSVSVSNNTPTCSVSCFDMFSQSGNANYAPNFTVTGTAGVLNVSYACTAWTYNFILDDKKYASDNAANGTNPTTPGVNNVCYNLGPYWDACDGHESSHITTLPTLTGYTFNGYWNTKSSETNGAVRFTDNNGDLAFEDNMANAEQFILNNVANDGTVTVYAHWIPNPSYNITYNLNGGTSFGAGYTPVEYIENDGRVRIQFSHANLYDSDNVQIYTKWMTTGTTYYNNSPANIGLVRQNGKNSIGITLNSGTNDTYALYGNTMTPVIVNNIAPNTTHEMWATTGSVILDNTKYTTGYGADTTINTGIAPAFFAWERGKLYDVYTKKNGSFIYAAVPARRDSDGMCGMMYLGSQNNTVFVAPYQNLDNGTAAFSCPNVSSKPDTYIAGIGADVVYEPLRVNSKFVGWCDDAALTQNCAKTRNISTSATGNKTLYAKWTCDDGYTSNAAGTACVANTITIAYDSNGGTAVSNATCSYNGNLTLPAAPTRQNYTFTGWNTANNVVYAANETINGGCWNWITGVTSGTSNNVITAQWQQNNIVYELDGGTNNANNPDNYTVGTETVISGVPTKSGYMFMGWCTDSAKTNCAMTQTIPDTETGTVTLYAKFEQAKFQIGTSSLAANTTFGFQISARGVFYVDWGDGTVQTIDRTLPDTTAANLTLQTVSHTYTTAGTRTIRFGGRATGYSTGTDVSTFKFGPRADDSNVPELLPNSITSYSGRLGALFPTLNDGSVNNALQPRFIDTFHHVLANQAPPANLFYDANDSTNSVFGATESMFECTFCYSSINAIPSELFGGADRFANTLFKRTFEQCPYLSAIPSGLFNINDSCKTGLFHATFFNTVNIHTLPQNLFSGVSGCAEDCFRATFSNNGLNAIPDNFFPNITCSALRMFSTTFAGNTRMTTIPADLFSHITSAASYSFNDTFMNNTALTTIPSGLFSSITSAYDESFDGTFKGCTNLTTLPENLFYSIKTVGNDVFRETFRGDTKLTTLPNHLFGATNPTNLLFNSTFFNTGLTSLPDDLFQSFTTCTGTPTSIFISTFNNTGLTSLPSNLFSKVTCAGNDTFNSTFANNVRLTSLPSGLFSTITTPRQRLFRQTFITCPNLKSVPYDLFGSLSGTPQTNMFQNTFSGDTALDTVVHPGQNGGTFNTSFMTKKFFGNLNLGTFINNGTFGNTFNGTALVTACPTGTTAQNGINSSYYDGLNNKAFCEYNVSYNLDGGTNNANNPATYIDNTTAITLNAPTKTGYDFDGWYGNSSFTGDEITKRPAYSYGVQNLYAKWAPHAYQCAVGTYLPKYNDWETNGYTGCIQCPLNNMCPGGQYNTNATTDQGITGCSVNPFAPTGSGVCYPHILHIGDNIAYLKPTKQTTPSLNIGVGNNVFYANMTTTPTYMNKDSTQYLRVKYDNTNYYVCDNTICPQ